MRWEVYFPKLVRLSHDLSHVSQKPAIDSCQLIHLIDRHAVLECLRQIEDALGVGHAQLQAEGIRIKAVLIAVAPETKPFYLEAPQRFLQRLLERAANCHRLAYALHLSR